MYGRITADFTLLDSLRINAGLAMGGGPIYVLASASMAGQSESMNLHMGGFFAPFVGVSYIY